jgi:hypothetical protein
MRTTLDIEDDVLQAAKEISRKGGGTAGQVISRLARRGLLNSSTKSRAMPRYRNGVPVLPTRGELVTLEHVEKIMDGEGI